ncbi:calcium-binding protein LPS1-alpha-like [Lytechinus pictus]|uniref:calcium-binding protein LPS1-alpha-like n=1 Tax=Lytechinus pictus TaxID=7653 RepID=UPI00240D0409|nr:calcium-binding protein LPS1-alpha-like [Lytechinus pictus]
MGTMYRGYTNEELAALMLQFARYDTNGNGSIGSTEFAELIKIGPEHVPTEEEIKQRIAEIDCNNDGRVQFEEFLLFMDGKTRGRKYSDEIIKGMFSLMDKDRTGKVGPEELRAAMNRYYGAKMTLEEACKIIRESDINGDGYIDEDDFVRNLLAIKLQWR